MTIQLSMNLRRATLISPPCCDDHLNSPTEGGFLGFGGTTRLTVGGRKKDELVEGVLWQVERVRAVIGDSPSVRGVLAFVDADWPLIGGDFMVRGVAVLWPKRLVKVMLRREPPTVDVDALARVVAASFPPA